MSTRIWSMMDVGKRSLMNSQTALQTVSHNVANKSTEGYSRQRVEHQSNVPVGKGKLRIGMGARATNVTRINNQFLEKQIERNGNKLGNDQAQADVLVRVEQVFNEQVNKGLNKHMGEFFNAFRELSNNPESLAIRTLVKESSDFLSQDFNRVHGQMREIQGEVDYRISAELVELNEITKEIASLNQKIQTVEMNAREANDERDRRDLLIKKLSEKVNIRYAESDDGSMTVTAGNTAVIVSGHSHREIFAAATPERQGKQEGNFDIFYKSSPDAKPTNITQQLKGGKIGGLLHVRDVTVNELIGNMDELAHNFANEVNQAHRSGFDAKSRLGLDLFDVSLSPKGAAQSLKVNSAIMNDVNRVVSGAKQNAPGDNRIANIISQLQYQKKIGGETTFDDYYNQVVGKIGVRINRANNELATQKDTVKQLKNIRESISGVSLDEETTKMIEFQKTYDASARLIRTADEMMETVLNLKRL